MLMLDQKCLRTTCGSISAPARKVSRMAPKPARKLTHGANGRPIDVAGDRADHDLDQGDRDRRPETEIIEAISASPSHKAEASQTFSMISSMPPRAEARSRLVGRWQR